MADPTPPPLLSSASAPPPVIPVRQYTPIDGLALPVYIKVFFAVVSVALIISVARIGHRVQLAIYCERGKRAFNRSDFREAAKDLELVFREEPNKVVRLDLAEAYVNTGKFEEANKLVSYFEGMRVSSDEETQLNRIESRLDVEIRRRGTQ